MDNRAAFLRVGLLIVVATGALAGLLWFFGGSTISNGLVYESYFSESVQGLEVGAPVKYRGVAVGQVTAIGLVVAEYNPPAVSGMEQDTVREVFVRYVVDPKRIGRVPQVADAIRLGLRAKLTSAGLTGVTYLEFDFVDPVRYPAASISWNPTGTYIPSMPSTLTEVTDQAQELFAKLDKVDVVRLSADAIGLLEDLRGELKSGETHQLIAQATGLLRTLDDNVRSADLAGLSADLRRTSGSYRALAENSDLRTAVAGMATAAARLPKLVAELQGLGRRADAGTADTQQALAVVLRDMQTITANLRDLTDTLRDNPASALTGRAPPAPVGNR